jgi:hypothetical protein
LDTEKAKEGTFYLGIINQGKRPAKSLRAQYEKAAHGVILPPWNVLHWQLRDGTVTTKVDLGFREPAKLELFKFKSMKDVPHANMNTFEIEIAEQSSRFVVDEAHPTKGAIWFFVIGVYGENDVEEHFTITITVSGILGIRIAVAGPVSVRPV